MVLVLEVDLLVGLLEADLPVVDLVVVQMVGLLVVELEPVRVPGLPVELESARVLAWHSRQMIAG